MLSLNKLPKIGMRTIKTSIAVMLCIIILKFISNNSPFFACVAAVVAMQNTVPGSWKAGVARMIGTVIGATIGAILSIIGINSVIITGIGVIIVIYLTNVLEKKESISIACIVYLAIMVNGEGGNPISYSLIRVLETFFGIIIAMVVNSVVLPPIKKNNVTEGENKIENNREK